MEAQDVPAKDFSGTSDPYARVMLLPDRKKKFDTKVTNNPTYLREKFLIKLQTAHLNCLIFLPGENSAIIQSEFQQGLQLHSRHGSCFQFHLTK